MDRSIEKGHFILIAEEKAGPEYDRDSCFSHYVIETVHTKDAAREAASRLVLNGKERVLVCEVLMTAQRAFRFDT